MVPNTDLPDALKNGGQLAVPMKSPKGDSVWVHASDVVAAQNAGGKVDWDSAPKETHEGFWSALGSTVSGMLKPQALNPYPGMGQEDKTQAAAQSQAEDQQRKAEGRSLPYRAIAPVGESVGANVPGMEAAARQGDTAGVMGHAVGSAVPVVAGTAIAEVAPKVGPKIEARMADAAPDLYRSALKPSTVPAKQAQVTGAIKTGLESGIPVSEAGLEKLGSLIDDVNDKIKSTIDANPNRPINKFSVASRLSDTAKKFSRQVNPTADLNAIGEAGNDFLGTQPNPIAASDAQALKTGTYQQLKGKAYGELKGASIESQKALARGLKEELANAFPELKDLNARDSQFYGLEPLLEKAVARINNHQLVGIGTPITAGAAKAVTGSSKVAAVSGMIKAVVDNPNVKSRLAIMLNKASKGKVTPALVSSRLAAYSAALGRAASVEAPDDQAQQ
jgi:hypothetical protein